LTKVALLKLHYFEHVAYRSAGQPALDCTGRDFRMQPTPREA